MSPFFFVLAAAVLANVLVPLLRVAAASVTPTPTGARATSVLLGSEPWEQGVRPGADLVPWPAVPGAMPGYEASVDGRNVGFATTVVPGIEPLLMGLGLVLAGLLVARAGLPGRLLLVTLGVGVLVRPMVPMVGLPMSLPFMLLPTMAAVTSHGGGDRTRRWIRLAGAATCGALVMLTGVVLLWPSAPWPWALLWWLPVVAGVSVVLIGGVAEAMPVVRRTAASPWGARLRALLIHAVPLARRTASDAEQRERGRLATQIHNDVLPRLGSAINSLDGDEPGALLASAKLQEAATALRGLITERQALAVERLGLPAAIESYVASLDDASIPVKLRVDAAEDRPPHRIELAAYRIVQAAVTNALSHSGADELLIELHAGPQAVTLRIADDGVGIEPDAERSALRRGHYGLADMRSQAEASGGTLSLRSTSAGTTVEYRWSA